MTKIKELIQRFDKEIFDAFDHSWACGEEIKDCICVGGTFWNQIARPIIEQVLLENDSNKN